jgi:hypothetical protein
LEWKKIDIEELQVCNYSTSLDCNISGFGVRHSHCSRSSIAERPLGTPVVSPTPASSLSVVAVPNQAPIGCCENLESGCYRWVLWTYLWWYRYSNSSHALCNQAICLEGSCHTLRSSLAGKSRGWRYFAAGGFAQDVIHGTVDLCCAKRILNRCMGSSLVL